MNRFVSKLASIFVFCLLSTMTLSAATPPPVGGVLPEIVLPAPERAEHRAYLGIKDKKQFSIPEIDASVVIVEIFSMY